MNVDLVFGISRIAKDVNVTVMLTDATPKLELALTAEITLRDTVVTFAWKGITEILD